jgi:hypothetical protein
MQLGETAGRTATLGLSMSGIAWQKIFLYLFRMPARRPIPRRPPLSAPRGQLRAAYRLTAGMSPAKVARAEAVAQSEIDALLAQPDFQELLTALAAMEALPEAERLRQLERLAWHVLELALADGNWRAAAFVADQMRRGCHPARSLAQSVSDAQARAAATKPGKPVRPRRARPYDAVDAAMGRAASGLRAILGLEAALAHLPEPEAAKPVEGPAATQPAAARPRRPHPLTARLRAGTAPRTAAAADHDPRGLLRA